MREVVEFAAALRTTSKALQFYSAEHPQAVAALAQLDRTAKQLLEGRERIAITAAKGRLVVDGVQLESGSLHVKSLAEQLDQLSIGGVVLTQGLSDRDLLELVRILGMKPQQLSDAGGAQLLLDRAGVVRIRISTVRYEAVTDGEEVVWAGSNPRRDAAANAADQPPDLSAMLRQFLVQMAKSPGAASGTAGAGEGPGAGGGGISTNDEISQMHDAIVIGMQADRFGAQTDSAGRELLREAVAGLEPEVQFALLLSISRLPGGALRDILRPAAAEMATSSFRAGFGRQGGGGGGGAKGDGSSPAAPPAAPLSRSTGSVVPPLAGAGTGAGGAGGGGTGDFLAKLLGALPEPDRDLELLRGRLEALGVSRDQLDEILGVLAWDTLSREEKLAKAMAGSQLFELPSEKLLIFFRDLLEAKMFVEALPLLDRYSRGLGAPSAFVRLNVCETLGQVAGFIREPGVSPEIDQLLVRTLLNHLVRETESKVQVSAAEAVANLAGSLLATGRVDVAYGHISRLAGVLESVPDAGRREARELLLRALTTPRRVTTLVEMIGGADAESLGSTLLPWVTFLGPYAAAGIVAALVDEEDRNRRGRLVRALKAIGRPAWPALVDALRHSVWFVVRNALNVLGDIGSPELVPEIAPATVHDDPRVRRAAARTLAKIRGPEAEKILVDALGDKDRETQLEVLGCLGAMRATSAVPALVDLVSKRGAFGRDPAPLRLAAAKALAAIGTPEAREALRRAAASEPDSATRSAMASLLPRPTGTFPAR